MLQSDVSYILARYRGVNKSLPALDFTGSGLRVSQRSVGDRAVGQETVRYVTLVIGCRAEVQPPFLLVIRQLPDRRERNLEDHLKNFLTSSYFFKVCSNSRPYNWQYISETDIVDDTAMAVSMLRSCRSLESHITQLGVFLKANLPTDQVRIMQHPRDVTVRFM
jgi:hypothetical protein